MPDDINGTTIDFDEAHVADAAQGMANYQPTISDYLETLVDERKTWEAECHRATHAGLYALLARVLRVYEKMTEDGTEGLELRYQFGSVLKNLKLKFNGDTHTVVKLCRLVFSDDRRMASAYGIVLRAALDAGKTHSDVAAWIAAAGGVEALRKKSSTGGNVRETAEEKAARAQEKFKDTELALVVSDKLRAMTDRAAVGKRVLLLATQMADGSYKVHAIVRKDSVVNSALAAVAGNTDAEAKSADARNSTVTPGSDEDLAALRRNAVREKMAA